MQEGFTIKFTPQASYELEPKTATPTGVIQLDGLVEKVMDDWVKVRVIWLMPAGWENFKYRSTPCQSTSYTVPKRWVAGLAGHPPTVWDPRTTASLMASARGARKQHGVDQEPAKAWWSDIGGLDQ